MPAENIIRVSEFEKLYYDDEKPFKQKHWEALCRYKQDVNNSAGDEFLLFKIINKGIQFTNYVGVLQAGNLTIEVLPKTDREFTTAANESIITIQNNSKQQWHNALLQMLQECRLLNLSHITNAHLNLQSSSIFNIYIELFVNEAKQLIHEGLIKNYQQKESNQNTLKGQLLFSKQIAQNSMHAERFYVSSTAYDADNMYNRILYKTLQLIRNISYNNYASETAGLLLLQFPNVSPACITAHTFIQLTFNRKTERYREAMKIAKMLLLNYRPDITGGSENVIAILFDMNKLWEEWVYRQFKKEEHTFGITVHRQQSADFWNAEHLVKPKTIRPDVVIQKDNQTIILDTKWKLIEDHTPGDEDLKQMFVYNLYWNCSESILLYPATVGSEAKSGTYVQLPQMNNEPGKCRIITQSVFRKSSLNLLFGKHLLDKIMKQSDNL